MHTLVLHDETVYDSEEGTVAMIAIVVLDADVLVKTEVIETIKVVRSVSRVVYDELIVLTLNP